MEYLGIIFFLTVFVIFYFQLDNHVDPQWDRDARQHSGHTTTVDSVQTKASIYISTFEKQAYLKSPEWNTLRKSILRRDNYTCQGCGITNVPLEVHHLHYRNFGMEKHSDLVAVCRECHQAIHDKYGYDYSDEFPLA